MGRKILVVDDNAASRAILKAIILNIMPQTIILEAADGQRALEIVHQENPDLVFLDIIMSEMDGYEVCQKIKTDPKCQHIPVLIMTALHKESEKKAGMDAGALDYIEKPFTRDRIIGAIQKVFGQE